MLFFPGSGGQVQSRGATKAVLSLEAGNEGAEGWGPGG